LEPKLTVPPGLPVEVLLGLLELLHAASSPPETVRPAAPASPLSRVRRLVGNPAPAKPDPTSVMVPPKE